MLKLTKENYFSVEADKEYMSNSQMKGFIECEAKKMAQLDGIYPKEDSQAFLQGRYVHSWNEGTMLQFEAENPSMISSMGKTKGQLKKEFKKCGDAIEVLKSDPLIIKALEGQKEIIFTADLFGTKWKCMLDSYNPEQGRFADLKYLKSFYDKFWNKEESYYENVFEYYGYYQQLSVYAEIERIATKREGWLEPFLVMVDKQEIPDKMIMSFTSEDENYTDFIARNLTIIEYKLPRILKVKNKEVEPIRCEKCDYCRSTKMLTGTTHYSKLAMY